MSDARRNIWFDPIPDHLRHGPIAFVVTWTIPAENHDKLQAAIQQGMDAQRLMADRCLYSRTRHWWKPSEDGATEQWWFMDEYDSAEAFEAMQRLTQARFLGAAGEKTAERQQYLISLMSPGTDLTPILYAELPGSRVEFEPFDARSRVLAQN